MLNPHIKPLDGGLFEELFDRAVERNAVLIARLRRATAALHLHAPDHAHEIGWTDCPHEDCRKTAELVRERPRLEWQS